MSSPKFILVLWVIVGLLLSNPAQTQASPEEAIALVKSIIQSRMDYKMKMAQYFEDPSISNDEKQRTYEEVNALDHTFAKDFRLVASDLRNLAKTLDLSGLNTDSKINGIKDHLEGVLTQLPDTYPSFATNLAQLTIQNYYLNLEMKKFAFASTETALKKSAKLTKDPKGSQELYSRESGFGERETLQRLLEILRSETPSWWSDCRKYISFESEQRSTGKDNQWLSVVGLNYRLLKASFEGLLKDQEDLTRAIRKRRTQGKLPGQLQVELEEFLKHPAQKVGGQLKQILKDSDPGGIGHEVFILTYPFVQTERERLIRMRDQLSEFDEALKKASRAQSVRKKKVKPSAQISVVQVSAELLPEVIAPQSKDSSESTIDEGLTEQNVAPLKKDKEEEGPNNEPALVDVEEDSEFTIEQEVVVLSKHYFKNARRPNVEDARRANEELRAAFAHSRYAEDLRMFFDDSRNHHYFTFEDIQALVRRVGGRITFNAGSSHCRVVVPGGLSHSWRPHGKGHSARISSFGVRLFRDAFIQAGLTPETLL